MGRTWPSVMVAVVVLASRGSEVEAVQCILCVFEVLLDLLPLVEDGAIPVGAQDVLMETALASLTAGP